MKVIFLGSGSFFTYDNWQTNILIEGEDSGRYLLMDAGTDIRHSLREFGVGVGELGKIGAVYISHLHDDHAGGLGFLAFGSFFVPGVGKPELFMVDELMSQGWEQCWRGNAQSIEGKEMTLSDYFHCHRVPINSTFEWGGIPFTPVQTVHVMSGYAIVHSYGLLATINNTRVFFTTDTQFCPHQIEKFYDEADLIFHDCETAPYESGVHASYKDLCTLPAGTKGKMWLVHYNDRPVQNPTSDGFLGFVEKGQVFEF